MAPRTLSHGDCAPGAGTEDYITIALRLCRSELGSRPSRRLPGVVLVVVWEEEGGGVRSGPGAARTILLLHIISARPSKQPLMVRTFLKV
jgi:hypothetical protein